MTKKITPSELWESINNIGNLWILPKKQALQKKCCTLFNLEILQLDITVWTIVAEGCPKRLFHKSKKLECSTIFTNETKLNLELIHGILDLVEAEANVNFMWEESKQIIHS